ncbi:MAG TPA: hypothetical protein VGX28_03925 [Frankiaceae bacterium]|jgi:hypothetical protein|nr:hypothetical protein [Frankiaceae bacterium]
MRRLVLAPALALALLAPHAGAAPAPQVTDPSGDANFTANVNHEATRDNTTVPLTQAYADVTSVLWQTTKTTKKVKGKTVTTVTGFTVTTTLSGPPTPPDPTALVYRMLGTTPKCGIFGVVYYTNPGSDDQIPQSALRDDCIDETIRLTAIPAPVIKDNTITWTVPMSAIPADSGVKAGTKITDLWFEVRELQDYNTCTPDDTPELGRTCGAANGVVDNSAKDGDSFTLA